MDAGDRDKLDELLDLTRENNKILRAMKRRFAWSQVFTFVYWLIILGVAGWSYYYFQPYIEEYMDVYKTVVSSLDSLKAQSESFSDIQKMMGQEAPQEVPAQ